MIIDYKYTIQGNKLVLELLNSGESKSLNIQFAKEKFYIVNLYNSGDIPAIPFEITL